MAAPSHADTDDGKQAHSPRQIVRHLLHVPFLRNIFAACLLAALAFPLYLWLYPARSDHGSMPLLAIAAGMLTIVAAALYKAGQAMLAHQTVDAALRQVRDELEIRAKTRTRELLRANAALQRKIAEHRRTEAALRASEARFRLLIETIPNPVFFKDHQGKFMGCNAAYSHTVGLPREKIIGRRLVDLPGIALSDMAEHYHRQDLALIRTPGIQVHEEQLICADGGMRDYMLFKATFRNEEGKVAGMVGVMLDITERKEIERALKASKNLFDAFMQHLPGLAFMKDPDGRYLFVNHAFSRFVGMAADAPIGLCDATVWDPESSVQLQANEQAVRENQTAATVLETIRIKGQSQRVLLTTRFPIFDDNTLTALGGIAIDITEHNETEQRQRQLERQLQQARKMEALGTLAGGIAHDFNNILAAVIGYTQIALADLPKDAPTHRYLQRVLEAGERAETLVKQILSFSRKSDIEPRPLQIKLIVKEVLQLVRATLPATITFVPHIQSDATVMADPVQIHQVMMNLCANAGYAMQDMEGVLTIALEDVVLDADLIRQHADLKPGPYVKLSVKDTGPGIAPEHLSRIFDPFFTTKPKGEGTGMGLSVVHGIITGLGGMVTVQSAPGRGTCFDLYLPSMQNAPAPMKRQAEALPVGTEKILCVDDESVQTDILKHMLELLGYKVETCNNSKEALALFAKEPRAFDLVITDLVMPGMRGDDLAARMLDLRADLPVILCTGYGENITVARTEAIGIRAFMLKPLSVENLAHSIRKVLDGPG